MPPKRTTTAKKPATQKSSTAKEEPDNLNNPKATTQKSKDTSQKPQPQPRKRKANAAVANDSSPSAPKEQPSPKKSKQTKTIGSKHDSASAPAAQASADRLPSKGQSVTWRAMPGWVEGTVLEILRAEKTVEGVGKMVKASEGDPRLVLKSHAKSGKICVHKPSSAVYFD